MNDKINNDKNLNVMKIIKLNFPAPKVLSKQIQNNKLILELQWSPFIYGRTIITKSKYSYTYEDVGFFKRSFESLDNLLWEYELPRELKNIIESL